MAENQPATREEMLRALQADVNAWPQRVRDAGVTKIDGSAYVPVPRNNAILRTPNDPEATLRYMIEEWESPRGDEGSDGWFRIISHAGPQLTGEYLMVDAAKVYAPLFPEHVTQRVESALDRDASTQAWRDRQAETAQQAQQREQAKADLRASWRSGERTRPAFPELDSALRARRPTET